MEILFKENETIELELKHQPLMYIFLSKRPSNKNFYLFKGRSVFDVEISQINQNILRNSNIAENLECVFLFFFLNHENIGLLLFSRANTAFFMEKRRLFAEDMKREMGGHVMIRKNTEGRVRQEKSVQKTGQKKAAEENCKL